MNMFANDGIILREYEARRIAKSYRKTGFTMSGVRHEI